MWLALLMVVAVQGPARPPTPLTLEDALRQARLARGRPGAAAAGVAEARAQRSLAGRVPNPDVSYEHTGDPPRQHFFVAQSLSWLLTRGADRAAAAADIRRAQADSVGTLAELVQDVRIAFFSALGGAETLRLVEEQVGFSDSLTRIARARLSVGDISQFEYAQVAQDARRAQQLLSETREAALTSEAALRRALGWTESAPPVPAGPLDADLLTESAAPFASDSIPVVRSAVADSLAAALNLVSARRARLPIPSLTAGAEWDDPDQPGQTLGVIGLALPLPLWHVSGAEVALARARAELAASETRETRLEATRAVSEAQVRLAESARRARFARDSLVPAARELRLRAVAAYRAGETGVLPVLDAMRSEREVVLEGVAALVAFQEARARWGALLGRLQ
ncbi:MAG TPA: TolC family protein [Gemmatimonadales bacterium]|nr:TolC family protein [Gemmatimonadales bacterium]